VPFKATTLKRLNGLRGWIAAGLLLAPIALGQTDGVLRVDTELVVVDVAVRGDSGAIEGLTRDDFSIYDNGQEQQITVFDSTPGETDSGTILNLPAGAAANRRDWRGARPTSATIVLVDRVNTPTDAQVFVNGELERFFETLDENAGIALYELRSDRGLTVVHDFTDNPDEILAKAAALESEHSLMLESSSSVGGFESTPGNVGLDPELSEFLSEGADVGFQRGTADYFLNERAQRTSQALETITRRLAGLEGRKNLVWLAGRFPFTFDVYSSTDLVEEIEPATLRQIDSVGAAITDANIAVYPVDVRGPAADVVDVANVSEKIADTTGGRRFRTNAIGEAIRAALGDSEMIYTLGFSPLDQDQGRGRRSLRVEVSRDDVEVLHRPNYVGFGSQTARGRADIATLLGSSVDATRIGLTGIAGPSSDGSGQFDLVTIVDVNDLKFVTNDGQYESSIEFGMVFRADGDGGTFVIPPATYPLRLSEEQFAQTRQTGYIVQRKLNTDGLQGAVRVVVQDSASGDAGSFWVSLQSQ
jgi:VWFA-related protein